MDRTLMRHPLFVALFGLIGGVFLASCASAATGNEVVSANQPEYTLGDTAVIYGLNFTPGSSVIVEVIRSDGSIVTGNGTDTPGSDTVTASATGSFTYFYLIDGATPSAFSGTLTVKAKDASTLAVLATTTFKDGTQFMLQGCSRDHGDCTFDNLATGWADGADPMAGWTSGNLKGWFEGEDVPFRLRIGLREAADAGTYYLMNEHDNLREGVLGIDSASLFYVGAGPSVPGYTEGALTKTCTFQATRLVGQVPTVGNPCIVTGPTYTDVDDDGDGQTDEDAVDGIDNDGDGRVDEDPPRQGGTSAVRRIQYVWAVLFNPSETGDTNKKWALYWAGHLASGSHSFPGASLHTNTTATGNQDVPISDIEAASGSGANLSITKTDTPDPVLLGQNLTYTIVVANAGPNSATNVTVSDALPMAATFVSATASQGTCSMMGGTVTCALGTLANGANATVTVVLTPLSVGTLSNTAIVSSSVADPISGNNTSTATPTVNPGANLSVNKTASASSVQVGQNLTYTITVYNAGPNSATGVTVTDTLPAGVNLVSASASPGCTTSTVSGITTVTCSLGTLGSFASGSATIVVQPTTAAVPSITNTASATSTTGDPNPGNNSASVTTTVNPAPAASADLAVTKTDSPDPVSVGQNLTYTIRVTNYGPATATAVTVTDTLPGTATFVSVTPGSPTCTKTNGTVTCLPGNLSNGVSTTVTIVVQPNQAGMINNTASVTATESDPNTINNTATAGTTVGDTARFKNVSTRGPVLQDPNIPSSKPPTGLMYGGFTIGGDSPKKMVIRGFGPSMAAPPFNISGTLADPVINVYSGQTIIATSDNWQDSPTCPDSNYPCDPPSNIPADLQPCYPPSSPPPGCALESAVMITLPPGAYTVILNGKNNTTGVGRVGVTDPDTSTLPKLINVSTRGFVKASPDLMHGGFIIGPGTSKKVIIRGRGPSLGGAPFFVQGTLANPKMQLYSGTTVIAQNDDWQTTDPLCGSPIVACGGVSDIVATGLDPCQPNPLQTTAPPGCDKEAALVVTLPPGPYTVVMSGVNNTSGVALFGSHDLSPDLSITKGGAPDPVSVGQNLTYTITVTNNGFGAASGVQVTDNLPPGVTFVSAGPNCSQASGVVTCNVGSLSNGANATMTIVVQPNSAGTIINSVVVTGNEGDPNLSNNSGVVTTTVNP